MERTIPQPAVSADEKAVPVEKPPAESPISSAWEVFERMVVPPAMSPGHRRALTHAFYAGARAAFFGVVDAMAEIEANEPDGDKRLAMVEREVTKYFADIAALGLISRTGKA